MNTLSLTDWMTAMSEATCESAVQMFAMSSNPESIEILSPDRDIPDGFCGSFITLVSELNTVQLGFLSDKKGLKELSQAMLGLSPEDTISDSDVTDAVGEIINVIAGGVKRRLNENAGGLKLGLPMFIEGKVAHGESQEVMMAKVTLGKTPTHLIVLRKRS